MNHFSVLLMLLTHRQDFLDEINQGVKIKSKIISLLIASSLCFAIYGGIIGAFSNWTQVISSAIKLPALYLITLLICLPTLYFFNVLFGSKQSIGQHLAFLLTAASVISVLLFSFAPVTLFFLITVNNYQFFLLLNVLIFTLTGVLGVSFLYQVMKPTVADDELDGARKTRTRILQFWLGLYGFVGSQLGWTLRPFFGSPGNPFELFRDREGNFYLAVYQAIREILF